MTKSKLTPEKFVKKLKKLGIDSIEEIQNILPSRDKLQIPDNWWIENFDSEQITTYMVLIEGTLAIRRYEDWEFAKIARTTRTPFYYRRTNVPESC